MSTMTLRAWLQIKHMRCGLKDNGSELKNGTNSFEYGYCLKFQLLLLNGYIIESIDRDRCGSAIYPRWSTSVGATSIERCNDKAEIWSLFMENGKIPAYTIPASYCSLPVAGAALMLRMYHRYCTIYLKYYYNVFGLIIYCLFNTNAALCLIALCILLLW